MTVRTGRVEIEPRLADFARIDSNRRALGGISMGGGLALTVAAHHPEDFAAVGGHSPVQVDAPELALLAGRMPIYLDAGRDDGFAESTESTWMHTAKTQTLPS